MTERRLVEVVQNICQSFIARPPRSVFGPIGLTQCGYERIAMLLSDFAVLVSMAAVEFRLLCQDRFLGSMGKSATTIYLGIDFGKTAAAAVGSATAAASRAASVSAAASAFASA